MSSQPSSHLTAQFETPIDQGDDMRNLYVGSEESTAAGEYFNSLPFEERAKLAPLLEHYRQMGLAEAHAEINDVASNVKRRIEGIRA